MRFDPLILKKLHVGFLTTIYKVRNYWTPYFLIINTYFMLVELSSLQNKNLEYD